MINPYNQVMKIFASLKDPFQYNFYQYLLIAVPLIIICGLIFLDLSKISDNLIELFENQASLENTYMAQYLYSF